MSARSLWGVFVVALAAGCSVLLVDDECDTAADCSGTNDQCIAGACVPRQSNNNGNNNNDVDPCPSSTPGVKGQVFVNQDVTQNTTWTSRCDYVLENNVFVENAVLTIEAGTTVLGQPGSALVITRTARIFADGTVTDPIVFTSSQPVGMRMPGDWGGVALLGSAPLNVPGNEEILEGLQDDPQNRGVYGGTDGNHSCGLLRYVRIEFAGFEAFLNNELNGLTLGGCGRDTTLQFIQVHLGEDDGIEFFGGNAPMNNIVISRAQDDSLDWDEGWTGPVQFLVIQQDAAGDNGFEADNLEEDIDAQPRSNPTIYNVTMVGARSSAGPRGRGMLLRWGTTADIGNIIVMGQPGSGLDLRTSATSSCAEALIGCTGGGSLELEGALFFDIGPRGPMNQPGTQWATVEGPDALDPSSEFYDNGFDEDAWLRDPGRAIVFNQDPFLADPYNLTNPGFQPIAASVAMTSTVAQTPPAFEQFDQNARFLGAIRAGAGEDWTEGWTSYPEN